MKISPKFCVDVRCKKFQWFIFLKGEFLIIKSIIEP